MLDGIWGIHKHEIASTGGVQRRLEILMQQLDASQEAAHRKKIVVR
ncbi:MAG: hypothetical protein A49_19930 [Methyloceanibacter sp.]|nr:MAG: hypothetical protein A49_19930 [Methyloceanibacter sp.]